MPAVAEPVHAGAVQPTTPRWHLAPAHVLLIGVSIAYCAVVVLRTAQSMTLTFDEVVYASQVARDVPAAMFSAPRSRGMSWLLAPVATLTPSPFAIRVYLTLMAGVGLYVAFRPWLTVMERTGGRYAYVPALAAASFATLWTTVLHGTMAYPNLWLAFAVVAGVGYFCRVAAEPSAAPGAVTGLGLAFAAASLVRPTDALAAAGPLLIAPLLVRPWRRLAPVVTVLAGLAVGWTAWIVEAYLRFDGPLERLKHGAETNASGLVFTLPEHLDALDGPALLCRPNSLCERGTPLAVLWWLLLPAMVGIGLRVARRTGWLPYALVSLASALALAAQYLFLIGYAAARFLQPTYGLLAIPVAGGLLWLAGLGRSRAVSIGVVSVLVTGHILVQQAVLGPVHGRLARTASSQALQADFLRDVQGVRPPCLMVGEGAIQLGYQLRCRSEWLPNQAPRENDRKIQAPLGRGEDVVVRLKADTPVPGFMSGWRRVRLPGTDSYDAYLPPVRPTHIK